MELFKWETFECCGFCGKRTNKFSFNYLIKSRKPQKLFIIRKKGARFYWELSEREQLFPCGYEWKLILCINWIQKCMKSLKAFFSRTLFTKIIFSFFCEVESNSSGGWATGEYIIYERDRNWDDFEDLAEFFFFARCGIIF